MELKLINIKRVLLVISGIVIDHLGGFDGLLKLMLIFMVFDVITGIGASLKAKKKEDKTSSTTMFIGVTKKIFTLIPIAMAYLIGNLIGITSLRDIAVIFYVVNDGLSIFENLGKIGIEYPEKIKDALVQLQEPTDKVDEMIEDVVEKLKKKDRGE